MPSERRARSHPKPTRRRAPSLRRARGDRAISAITGFAIAMAVYAVAFITFLSVSQTPAHSSDDDGAVLRMRAENVLAQLLDTPGWRTGTPASADWETDPDAMTRLGIAVEGIPGRVDVDKLRNLTRGGRASDPSNGFVDYEEARTALGLTDVEFHLQVHPVADPGAFTSGAPVKNVNVAYIGRMDPQYAPAPSNYPVMNSTRIEDKGDHLFVNVTITNNGTIATMFHVNFDILMANRTVSDLQYTPLMAPGQAEVVGVKLYKQPAWAWSLPNVLVNITDPVKSVGQLNLSLSAYALTVPPYVGGPYAKISVTPDKVTYKTSQFPKLNWAVVDARGTPVPDPLINLTVRNAATGAIVDTWEGTNGNTKTLCCKLSEGAYNVTIWNGTSTFNSTDVIVVTDDLTNEFLTGGGVIGWSESAASIYERARLADLVETWVDSTYTSGGDLYPDRPSDLNVHLAANLTNDKYEILLVGSNVNHTAMTDPTAQQTVKEWVRRGGLLVVLGSTVQSAPWLSPLTGVTSAGSTLDLRPLDTTHATLRVPNELGWQRYNDDGATWRFPTGTAAADFYHVVGRGTSDHLNAWHTISKPGRFGNGTIVLTGLKPFDLTTPQHELEARWLLHNLLHTKFRPTYLDLGPRVSEATEASSASRLATVDHPFLSDQKVLLRVTVYVFR